MTALLNPDGTIKPGVNGNFDARGYSLRYGAKGEPIFTQAQNPDDNWDPQFGVPGTNGTVYALAVSGSDVYVGGAFTTAGEVSANNIARWNGTTWSALGSGLNGDVYALAVSGSDVYVGGFFTTAGGVSANYIARWNGTSWSALGSGLDNTVLALAVSGSDMYVGGFFTIAGGVSANRIAKWNGTSWSALGSGLNSDVYALAVSGSDVYVGGNFSTAGEVSANNIAKWNGTSWSALGSGVDSIVYALAVSGSDLYVGGRFSFAGGSGANKIAKWNGTSWSALGFGVGNTVLAIAVSGSDVYIGGAFTTTGAVSANRIAKWNGTSWSSPGFGVNDTVYALAVSGSDVYVGGGFTAVSGDRANRIAKWNGTSWSVPSGTNRNGMGQIVYALAVSGSDVYVGGFFTTAGGISANNIAKWNGTTWSALGSGMDNNGFGSIVYALAVIGSDLYAGGTFTTAGGVGANNIARWNGTSWSALGSGMSSYVFTLAVSGSDLYAGGSFATAGGVSANYIAKWNGTSWSALGSGVDDDVYALTVSGNDVYVGGEFNTAGGVSANNIARWNGTSWSALGSGVGGIVHALAVSGSDLYVGGVFTTAGEVSANRIAKWNGTSWSALGSGLNSDVYALAVSGSDLYAGGSFATAGGVSANRIAKWNGTSWSALGSGVTDNVQALAVRGNDVFVGGRFSFAGGKPSSFFGRYRIVAANTAPKITASAALTRQQGSAGTVAPIATVSDAETAAGSLTVTAPTVPAGITVTNITNSNGTISVSIATNCNASLGANTITLQVSDGELTANANLLVNVTVNSPPTLGAYSVVTIAEGTGTTVLPGAPPSDNGTLTSVTVTGANGVTVDSTTGIVTIPNSLVIGTYPLIVTATDNCGAQTTATFTLTVIMAGPGYEADVSPRPNGNNNGAVTIADWTQVGRFIAALDTPVAGSEFQRADTAPKATLGDGKITVSDWVQAGRYAAGLDAVVVVGGPTTSGLSLSPPMTTSMELESPRLLRTSTIAFQRGEIGSLPIELEAQGNENAVGFSLNFDPQRLSFIEARVGSGANGAVLQVNSSQAVQGKLGVMLALPSGQQLAAGARTLLTLRFLPKGGVGEAVTNLSFSDQLLTREISDAFAAPIQAVNYVGSTITISGNAATNVSAASYADGELSADSIASAFGTSLATMTASAISVPLPNTLGGTSVKVTDSQGVARMAALFFVSPNQINYQIPADTAKGIASVTITNGLGAVTVGLLNISPIAPGIFSADASGQGWAAADVVYVKNNGAQVIVPAARFDAGQNKFVAVPIDVSSGTAVLVLYSTGLRERSALANVNVKVGGLDAPIDFAGAQTTYVGLDQVNVWLPKALAGRGEALVELTVDGKAANLVRVQIR